MNVEPIKNPGAVIVDPKPEETHKSRETTHGVKTGDTSRVFLYAAVCIASAAGLLACWFFGKKKKEDET